MCVQGVFDHRIKTWQKWQDSQLLLQKKREAEAKLQFTNKPDKLQQAKDEIKEVRRRLGGCAVTLLVVASVWVTPWGVSCSLPTVSKDLGNRGCVSIVSCAKPKYMETVQLGETFLNMATWFGLSAGGFSTGVRMEVHHKSPL